MSDDNDRDLIRERDDLLILIEWILHSLDLTHVRVGVKKMIEKFLIDHGEPHWIGKEVRVKAWWTKPNSIIRCRITELPMRTWSKRYDHKPNYIVQPLTGNPHRRAVSISRVEGNPDWEEPNV